MCVSEIKRERGERDKFTNLHGGILGRFHATVKVSVVVLPTLHVIQMRDEYGRVKYEVGFFLPGLLGLLKVFDQRQCVGPQGFVQQPVTI